MKKRNFSRIIAIALTLLLCLPLLAQPAAAATVNDSNEDPVFLLIFEDETTYIVTSAFLVRDTYGSGATYLVTTDISTYLLDDGYVPTLIGVTYENQATYLESVGNFAFYYAPGLEELTPLEMADDLSNQISVAKQGLYDDYVTGMETQDMDMTDWVDCVSYLYDEGSTVEDSAMLGAAAVVRGTRNVVGCISQTSNQEVAMTPLVDVRFPSASSLEAVEGVPVATETQAAAEETESTEEDEEDEGEEEGLSTGVYIAIGAAIVAVILFAVTRKTPKKNQSSAPVDSKPYQGTVSLDYDTPAPPVQEPVMDYGVGAGATAPAFETIPQYDAAPAAPAAPVAAAQWQVRALGGQMDGKVFLLNGILRFGRSSQNDVSFPQNAPGISGTHCELALENDQVVLRDLNSSYGTYLNKNVKMEPQVSYHLQLGDVFTLAEGGQSFRLEKAGQAYQEQTPVVRSLSGEVFKANMEGRITFGRDPRCQVSFQADSPVSGNHCVLYKENGQLYLMDTGSTNGTFFAENQRLKPNVPYKVRKGASFFLVSPKFSYVIIEE